MSNGFYLMHRGWLDHEVFGPEPYCERAAWAWLIDQAAHEPVEVPVAGRRRVVLQRGQLSHSVRFIARAWQWETTRAYRFLRRLSEKGMISKGCNASATADVTLSATGCATAQQIITICNYETYQRSSKKSATASATASATPLLVNAQQKPKNTNKPSDADAPPDLTKVLFGECATFIAGDGGSIENAKAFLGQLRKNYQDAEIIEVVTAAQREARTNGLVSPKGWIVAGLQNRHPPQTKARQAL